MSGGKVNQTARGNFMETGVHREGFPTALHATPTVKCCSRRSTPGCYSNIPELLEGSKQPVWKKHSDEIPNKIHPHSFHCQVTGILLGTHLSLCNRLLGEKCALPPHHCAFNSGAETRPRIRCQECTFPAGAGTTELSWVVLAQPS